MVVRPASPLVALCSAVAPTGRGMGLALNFEGGATAPEFVQLLPAGPRLVGIDGREFTLADPALLLPVVAARPAELVIDYDHATDLAAPKGLPAPAAGWIKELIVRDGALWGRVEWTAKAAAAIAAREWRYLSPVFNYDARDGSIVELIGASLVNRPNFKLGALNHEQGNHMLKDILAALGLAEAATAADAVTAINALKTEKQTALNAAATPDLTKFVPRADFDAALNRASVAEAKIKADAEAAHQADVAREIDAAIKAGKVAPASKDFYVATCATVDGLAAFKKHVDTLPSAFAPSGLGRKDPAAGGATALNAEQREVALAMGLDEKAFADHLAKEAAKTAA
jgi:phage I-like protein